VRRWCLAAVLALVVAGTAGCASAEAKEPASRWGKPHHNGTYTITYLLKGDGVAHVTYTGADGAPVSATVTVPWSGTVDLRDPGPATGDPVLNASGTGSLTCQIWVNGRRFSDGTAAGSVHCRTASQ